ncbi:concanavalin A-like lectin/glucanase domain-containing protein [Mycena alexandri]|uniref:Concanavalin A-like lectin/glucanase domain-containing protein n=1 Tax=Mycena alexandri TaxID=1745969 RepID=A0AAD6X7U2_9AGAR|nr:concanavalin A-like lectin/glucanase domain-containing protein [Mycena alexandri]
MFGVSVDDDPQPAPGIPGPDALFVLLPLLIVLSTLLFILFLVLVCALLLRRRRGIMLRDSDGPVDMSREELIDGEGGFDGLESRWLESVSDQVRQAYLRARDYQLQYLPNSLPTDITLSQFLSIQEKGVSAWSFEPDYETVNSLIVHARTEITFLPDPASSSCVQSNLPLPKLNEVYYWEVKMFDLPESTAVAVGLATKPYPAFRLPGLNRYSIAYHSSGEKSHNYPFTASQFGPPLKEGDVLGLGYRPRTGTVFFTRNGRKLEDAFVGLSRWNLFPTIGADGPCSVHVNLGQSGFVFIEANVKKWGLAPSVGTLAPPPAYGSERGSILLDVGGRVRRADGTPQTPQNTPSPSSTMPRRSSHRSRRPKPHGGPISSPLRTSSFNETPMTPPPPITPIFEETPDLSAPGPSTSRRYISPTDLPFHAPPNINLPSDVQEAEEDERSPSSSPASSSRSLSPDAVAGARNPFATPRRHRPSLTHMAASLSDSGSELTIQVHAPPESPMTPNPPTPNVLDIHLQALSSSSHRRTGSGGSHSSRGEPDDRLAPDALIRRDPPAYSPLDAFTYQDGVHIDLPAEVIAAALEGNAMPTSAIGHGHSDRTRRTRRH